VRKRIYIILFVVLAQFILMGCGKTSEKEIQAQLPHFNTLKDAIDWCESNLKFQNDDPWDPAPDLETIFKNKHGDCKMLAGAVYEVLKSIGQDSKIVTIKRRYWHMFVIYRENENWRVIDDAKLRKEVFTNLEQIKTSYGVSDFVKVSNSYDEFQNWFNKEIYPRR
jgi:hypothetical protein